MPCLWGKLQKLAFATESHFFFVSGRRGTSWRCISLKGIRQSFKSFHSAISGTEAKKNSDFFHKLLNKQTRWELLLGNLVTNWGLSYPLLGRMYEKHLLWKNSTFLSFLSFGIYPMIFLKGCGYFSANAFVIFLKIFFQTTNRLFCLLLGNLIIASRAALAGWLGGFRKFF